VAGVRATADAPRRERAAGWAGIAFVALSTVWAVVVTVTAAPQLSQATTQEFVSFYDDQGNRISLILASLSLAFAGFALLWFLGGRHRGLRKAEGENGMLSTTAVISGAILIALLFVFNGINVAVAWALEESDNFEFDPNSAQLFEGLSYLLAIQGALVGAALVWAASRVFRKTGIYPSWVAWGGLVIAVLNFLLAFPIHGVSLVLLLPWVLVVSVLMLTRPPAEGPGAS
jgi:hypothetical protein